MPFLVSHSGSWRCRDRRTSCPSKVRRFGFFGNAVDTVQFKESLNPVEQVPVYYWRLLTGKPVAAVMHFADIDPVFEEAGEGPVSERGSRPDISSVWCRAVWSRFAGNRGPRPVLQASQFEIPGKDVFDSISFSGVGDQLLALDGIT